jgi:hypothetical protein
MKELIDASGRTKCSPEGEQSTDHCIADVASITDKKIKTMHAMREGESGQDCRRQQVTMMSEERNTEHEMKKLNCAPITDSIGFT